jgi:hypothetical protein
MHGIFVGVVLFFLGLLGFLGSALALPAGPALNTIRGGRTVADNHVARAVAAVERSLRWGVAPAASLSDLALLKLVQAQSRDATTPEGAQLLMESLAAQETSLAQAPASTNGWARLTYARYALSGLDEASRDALAMSFLTGRLERAPMAFRVQLILREWEVLDPEMHALGSMQIRQLCRYGHHALDALVDVYLASDPAGREILLGALADSPEDHARFERRLRRKTQSP